MRMHQRKPNRLKEYDYSQNGVYFVTVCISNRDISLWDEQAFRETDDVGAIINRPNPPLSPFGIIVNEAICGIESHYDHVSVNKYVVMPNHLHIIFVVEKTNEDERAINNRPYGIVSTVMQQMKRHVTKQLGVSIWQKSFHDHIIRDENDYLVRWQYIDNNPARWTEDEYYLK